MTSGRWCRKNWQELLETVVFDDIDRVGPGNRRAVEKLGSNCAADLTLEAGQLGRVDLTDQIGISVRLTLDVDAEIAANVFDAALELGVAWFADHPGPSPGEQHA